MSALRSLPIDITDEEAAFGFAVRHDGQAVAAELRNGLYAVKVVCDDGAVGYCVCDARLSPLYPVARSLRELHDRFRWSFRRTYR